MPTISGRARPIEKFAEAAAKCSVEVSRTFPDKTRVLVRLEDMYQLAVFTPRLVYRKGHRVVDDRAAAQSKLEVP